MANVSRKMGFRPVKHLSGAPYNGQVNLYEIGVGDGAATFVGDLVKMSDEAATGTVPTAERYGTSGEVTSGAILGAIVGFVIAPTDLNTPQYRAASTLRYALVADSPDLIFEVEDGATVATPVASINLNCGVQATAGSTTTGVSNMTTGNTAATTTNTLPLRIVGIVNSPDNTGGALYQKLLVKINVHAFADSVAGV